MERCEDCGFAWDEVGHGEIGRRITSGTAAIADLLTAEPVRARERPGPERWSMLEYGAHVRDVLLTLRDRLVVGLIENDPGFKPMYRDERVDLGLYRAENPDDVASELAAATAMFVRLFEAIDEATLSRPVQYGYPGPVQRTLLWMAQQAVHEVEHHRNDIDEDLQLVSGNT